MSGGFWNYEDATKDIPLDKLPIIIEALRAAWHEVDWAESSDTSREDAGRELYNILLKLGNEIWGQGQGENWGKVPSSSELYKRDGGDEKWKSYAEWFWRNQTRQEIEGSWYSKKGEFE